MTMPFRVSLMRSQVLYLAAQVSAHYSNHVLLSQEAERAGITIDQRSVPLKELQACMLAGSHLIIALVDKRRLCSGLMWSRPASLQIGGVNRMPIICGYGDAYTGAALMSPAVAMQSTAEMMLHCAVAVVSGCSLQRQRVGGFACLLCTRPYHFADPVLLIQFCSGLNAFISFYSFFSGLPACPRKFLVGLALQQL